MKYAIIDTAAGRAKGINPAHHLLFADGSKMMVNENELRLVSADIDEAARAMGGEVITHEQAITQLKKLKHE